MIQRILMILAVALLLVTSVAAAELTGQCTIHFYGDSTLHGFEGQVACQPFVLSAAEQTSIKVLVAEMDTDNSGRDKKMRAMFQSETYPLIEGLFADIDPQQVVARLENTAGPPVVLPFTLKIRQISQPVQAKIRELSVSAEKLSFNLEFPLSLASYQLEPPSVLGFIRVADQVRVEVRVALQRE